MTAASSFHTSHTHKTPCSHKNNREGNQFVCFVRVITSPFIVRSRERLAIVQQENLCYNFSPKRNVQKGACYGISLIIMRFHVQCQIGAVVSLGKKLYSHCFSHPTVKPGNIVFYISLWLMLSSLLK